MKKLIKEFSLKKRQSQVDELVRDMGGYWPPLAMLASITEEIGELAREINAKEGIKIKKSIEREISIGEELADSIFSLMCIANHYDINLDKEFNNILKKYRKRDKNRFN